MSFSIQKEPVLSGYDPHDYADELVHICRLDDETVALCGKDLTDDPYWVDDDTEATCIVCAELEFALTDPPRV